jgi:hypothetical protein
MSTELLKANELYKQAQQPIGLSRTLKRSNLERAIRIYNAELPRLTNNAESASSMFRNIGMANLKLSDLIDEGRYMHRHCVFS